MSKYLLFLYEKKKYEINFVETLGKSIKNIVDSIFLNIDQSLQYIEMNSNISQTLDDISAKLNASFSQAKPIIEQFKENLDKLPERIADALLVMANHGWYLDPDLPWNYIFILSGYLDKGEISEVELFLAGYFAERLDYIENEIIQKFPHREKIISSAFNAHRREEYEIAINSFFCLIDGICHELYGQHFFRTKHRKPRTADYIEQKQFVGYKASLFKPLSEITTVNMTENQRDENFSGLNRHMVLHGDSLDYGTKINSFKAISLLNYVSNILKCV